MTNTPKKGQIPLFPIVMIFPENLNPWLRKRAYEVFDTYRKDIVAHYPDKLAEKPNIYASAYLEDVLEKLEEKYEELWGNMQGLAKLEAPAEEYAAADLHGKTNLQRWEEVTKHLGTWLDKIHTLKSEIRAELERRDAKEGQ
jgi:hypothetical protein